MNIALKQRGIGFTLYSNEDYLPMGFTYDSYIDETIIDSLNMRKPKPDVPLQLLVNLAVPKEEGAFFAKHLKPGTLDETANIDSIVAERRKHTASTFEGTTHGFTSVITLPHDDIVFYSVPADKGFTAYIDGRMTEIHACNLGLSAVLVPQGTHTVEFRFLPRGLKAGSSVSLAALVIAFVIVAGETRRVNGRKKA